jgi:hypothetical protein
MAPHDQTPSHDAIPARTKRRVLGAAIVLASIVLLWIALAVRPLVGEVSFTFANRSGTPVEQLQLIRDDGELQRALPVINEPLGYGMGLSPSVLAASTLRIVHETGTLDIDLSHHFEQRLLLRVDVVVESMTPNGVHVTSSVESGRLRQLLPW